MRSCYYTLVIATVSAIVAVTFLAVAAVLGIDIVADIVTETGIIIN